MDERNVLKFPTSARERRRILRRSEDPRLRAATVLASVCGWLLTLSLVLFMVTHFRLLLPDSLRRMAGYIEAGLQPAAATDTIAYASGSMRDGEVFANGLAYADSDTLYVSKPGGLDQLTLQLSYGDPVVETSDRLILAYDRGGKAATLANALNPIAEIKTESPILTGSISRAGGCVLVTDEAGYRTAAAVYDTDGKQVFKWYSSEYYIMSAALSADGNYMAAVAFKQDDVELETQVLFWRLGRESETAEASVSLGNVVGYEIGFLGSWGAAVVTDHGGYLISRSGDITQQAAYSPSDLRAYAIADNGLILATGAYGGSVRTEITSLRADGTAAVPLHLGEDVQYMSLAGDRLGVLTGGGVAVYDANTLEPLWSNTGVTGARGLRMDETGRAYVLYGNAARIFTAETGE